MPSTPVMGNGRQRNAASQEDGRRFAWLSEKRLVSALSGKQDYEVRELGSPHNELVLCRAANACLAAQRSLYGSEEGCLVRNRSCGWS